MWVNCSDKMPRDMEVVIALYLGHWPGRGNSGVIDIHTVDGKWFNIPEDVHIVGWMPSPDTAHLPIAEYCTNRSNEPIKLLGYTETCDPAIYECVFEGDYSEINQKCTNQ